MEQTMRRNRITDDDGQFGPHYTIGSTALAKFRRQARKAGGAMSLDRAERIAYANAVEAAVLKAQRPAQREVVFTSASASGTFHNNGDDIHRAVLAQQRAALHRQGPGRTPEQWQVAYDLAMGRPVRKAA
jgi:hypothetical protein